MTTHRLHRPHRFLRRSSRGFSLVELMVALTIGLVLLAGLGTLFANSSQAGSEINKSIRQMESGRFAAELLGEDINLAGYYGDISTAGMGFVNANACETAIGNLGWSNASAQAPVAVTGLTAAEAAALGCLTNYKAGTPALVIRRMDPATTVPGVATNGGVYVQTSRCTTDPVATSFIISDKEAEFVLRNQDCTSKNPVRRFLSRIYYIASCSDCAEDTIPTLKRAELIGNRIVVSPLAEGIDDIGFDFAFDTNGDGMADTYLAALNPPPVGTAATNTWSNVVGVRTYLLSRTSEPSASYTDGRTYSLGLSGTRGPFTDGHKRKAYTLTARLNNVAGPREVQP